MQKNIVCCPHMPERIQAFIKKNFLTDNMRNKGLFKGFPAQKDEDYSLFALIIPDYFPIIIQEVITSKDAGIRGEIIMKIRSSKIIALIAAFSMTISMCTGISYAAGSSIAPNADSIIITNNAGTRDTVYVSDLNGGDLVRVYNAESGGKVLGSATVSTYGMDITVYISQLGTGAGSVYVAVTNKGASESERVRAEYTEEPKSDPPFADSITISNNARMADTVEVAGIAAGDVVKVYNSAKGGKLLGSATMSGSKTEVSVRISQLGAGSGSVFVAVTSKGARESERVEAFYSEEPQSDAPFVQSILISNNAGMSDTVYVTDLTGGDAVKVYNAEKGGKLLGSATASTSKVDATVTIKQLGVNSGSVYVSITSKGKSESDRIKAEYLAETKSDNIVSDYIAVTNNPLGTPDTVEVYGLSGNDTVKVYSALKGGKLLGSATVAANGYYTTVNIPQIGADGGSIFISVTSKGKAESDRIETGYAAEPKSGSPNPSYINVSNNAGSSDTIEVSGLSEGDAVKVYNAVVGGRLLGSATVGSNKTSVTITVSQLGASAGAVYISVTNKGANPSDRAGVSYPAEAVSGIASSANIAITNNPAGTSDTIEVTNVQEGDVVKVYTASKGGSLLGAATVAKGKSEAVITIAQLGMTGGNVYISITSKGKLESDRVMVDYAAESSTAAPDKNNILITNNSGSSDTVEVRGISVNDVIRIYDAAKGGRLLGTATVQSGKTTATVTIAQLGAEAGNIYVSVAAKGKNESGRVEVGYPGEAKSIDPNGDDVVITNNAGTPDTIDVTGLMENDVINVYDSENGGNLLGTGTVKSGKKNVTITITQLGASEGSVYISLTAKNKLESGRIKVGYAAEAKTNAPNADNIAVTNNPEGVSDIVDIIGISSGDIVNVYDSDKGGKLLGTATVQGGKTSVAVAISQLGMASGSVYVTATSTNKLESDRVQVGYDAEKKTNAPEKGNIVVTNNPAGTPDTVFVDSLSEGDIVNVYDSDRIGKLLGTATVQSGAASATVTISQLGASSGDVYVSVTGKNKLESERTQITYADESRTNAPIAENVTVSNNAGEADTILITGAASGDIAKVYDALSGGSMLGSATVPDGSTDVTVSVSQLGSDAGSVYITLTAKKKLESTRTKVDYAAEAKTKAPDADSIIITNNAGTADIVTVTELSAGDTVKVYDAAKGGSLLGTGTVSTYGSSVSVSIEQLGVGAGKVYVSVTGKRYKLESDRTEVGYTSEPKTGTPALNNITITNNAGIADAVKVIGLSAGDIVNVYDASVGGNLLGTATVNAGKTNASVSINQLGAGAGKVYVSITSAKKLESDRTEAEYEGESKSAEVKAGDIVVANNAGMASTVKVTGLSENDIINVYDAPVGGNLLGTAVVPAYKTEVTVTISQLGAAEGSVYVTVTGKGKLESDCTEAKYLAKPKSAAPAPANVDIVNNAGIQDSITVTNLTDNDIVNIYDASAGGNLLGTGTAQSGNSEVTVSITQIGTAAGSVYITVTSIGKLESERTEVAFEGEQSSVAPAAGNITVVNNAGMAGSVTVTGLTINDVVKVYDAASGGNLLGTATMTSISSPVVIAIPQLGNSAGSIYISVKSMGKTESSRTKADYSAVSTPPAAGNIVIVNNTGIADTVTVNGLTANDLIKVYDAAQGGNLLGSASANGTQATLSISQLTAGAGSVYITVTSFGKAESSRTKADYISERSSVAPFEGNITVVNNVGIADTVTVAGLAVNDVVKVYDSSVGGTLLGSASVASGSTQAVVKITQLGTSAGNIYVSIITLGKSESYRTTVDYAAEQCSNAPYAGNISIINNPAGTADTITVSGLAANDVIRVYDSAEGGSLLGSVTVPSGNTQGTVIITQLSTYSGSAYISVMSLGKTESDRTRAYYTAEK